MNVLSLSYGKDSLACLGACEKLGWKIDKIIHAEVWATDTIQADLPPMVEFKDKADKIIKERWGIDVKHIYATDNNGEKLTYEKVFYKEIQNKKGKWAENRFGNKNKKYHKEVSNPWIYGFPCVLGPWCNSRLKVVALENAKKEFNVKGVNSVLGIAVDERERVERHQNKENIILPLVEIGWTEADCKQWCIDNDLLSPLYNGVFNRGGCWFCHNMTIDEMRVLRRDYPDLWRLLMKWDDDSPCTFHADGKTVHDFDRRFQAEDDGFINSENSFRWGDLDMQQFNINHYINANGELDFSNVNIDT